MNSIEMLLKSAHLPESSSPRLDAELLLAQVLGKPRSFLRTWPEHTPTDAQQAQFLALLWPFMALWFLCLPSHRLNRQDDVQRQRREDHP